MIVVFGAGRQGECLIYALKELGHKVVAADNSFSQDVLDIKGVQLVSADVGEDQGIDFVLTNHKADLAISCLPYFLNEKVAKACIDRKIPYFDLGGHVGISAKINDYAETNDGQVFTDLGLAPGWVNIMAEECYRKADQIDTVKSVYLRCGGLPLRCQNPPFNYNRTWSTDGLLNEYKDECWILDDGVREVVPGMSGIRPFHIYEEFHTSGGIGKTLELMEKRGVRRCTYKTLRLPGHIEAVKTMIEAGIGPDVFNLLFPESNKDFVVVTAKAFGENSHYELFYTIECDDRFTAMQKCTAFPVAAVAHMFLDDTHEGLYINCRDYSHVNYNEFSSILSGLLGEEL